MLSAFNEGLIEPSEVSNTLKIPWNLEVSIGSGDHLPSGGPSFVC